MIKANHDSRARRRAWLIGIAIAAIVIFSTVWSHYIHFVGWDGFNRDWPAARSSMFFGFRYQNAPLMGTVKDIGVDGLYALQETPYV